jgi:hypothetical protein
MTFLRTKQVAKRYRVVSQTVSRWCQRSLFPNMILGLKAGRGAIYLIPETDLEGFTPPELGRPTDADPSPAAAAKRRSQQRRAPRSTKTDT